MHKVRVVVTGAAGQIGYSLLFRIASGEVFGSQTSVELHLLEVPQAVKAAEGTAMELMDCGFSSLASVNCFDTPENAFDGAHWGLLVGSKPRGPGMERGDLIRENGPIFIAQGKALLKADSSIRTVVVGNPCNTNALIALSNCPEVPASQFSAMTMLDENRARAQIADQTKTPVASVQNMFIWGNHSPTMFPNFENAKVADKTAVEAVNDRPWLEGSFLEKVQKRGAEIIQARGKSSAASAASACIDHIMCLNGSKRGKAGFSAAILSQGDYDLPKGILTSLPVRIGNNGLEIIEGIQLSEYAKTKIKASTDELLKERSVVEDLLPK